MGAGSETWSNQLTLADSYRLLILDRGGYGDSPSGDGDFERDAEDVAALLDDAHVVGNSYGGVVALLATARRPEAVRSLTVIEPPALGLVRGRPEVEEFIERVDRARREATDGSGRRAPRSPARRTLHTAAMISTTCSSRSGTLCEGDLSGRSARREGDRGGGRRRDLHAVRRTCDAGLRRLSPGARPRPRRA